MNVIETERLTLRLLTSDDAPFTLQLLNDPAWLRFIGDRGVRTVEDAKKYIWTGPVAMYERLGFGLYMTERKSDRVPMGICGLIQRDGLADIDIGFAFLPQFRGCGYGYEAALATMACGKNTLRLKRIVGITSPDNLSSITLLEKIGLKYECMVRFPKSDDDTMLFAWSA